MSDFTTSFSNFRSNPAKWVHNHPRSADLLEKGALITGAAALVFSMKNRSLWGVVASAALCATGAISERFRPLLAPPHYDPKEHALPEGECRGVKLFYKGDLPILERLPETTSYDFGYGRGYLLAEPFYHTQKQLVFALHTLRGIPRAEQMPNLIAQVRETISEEVMQEMQGFVEGYNARRQEWRWNPGKELTLQDLIGYHLLSEMAHLGEGGFRVLDEGIALSKDGEIACTSVIDGTEENGPQFLRILDWHPLDVHGRYSYIQFRRAANGVKIVEHSIPGQMGSFTGMNRYGLCLAINLCQGSVDCANSTNRQSNVLAIREALESCKNVGEVRDFFAKTELLGPFHLTMADPNEAGVLHLLQGGKRGESHHYRAWSPDKPLATTNNRICSDGSTIPPTLPGNNSQARMEEIQKYYEGETPENPKARLQEIMRGKEVCNPRTLAVTIFDPRKFGYLNAFDNGWAGDRPLVEVPAKEYFED